MVDSCGWIAVIEAGINIDLSLLEIFGKYEFIVINSVWRELNEFQESNNRSILLEILEERSINFENNYSQKHTDDVLLSLSREFGWPVLTVDKKLKNKLFEYNCKVIQVVGGKKIELIS